MLYNLRKWTDRRRFKKRFPGVVFIPRPESIDHIIEVADGVVIMVGVTLYPGVTIGSGVFIGPYSQVREGTTLEDGVKIGAKCNIEWGVTIGARTNIQGLSMVPEKVIIGADCFLGQMVGMMTDKYMDGNCEPPRIGNRVKIGGNVQILPGAVIGDDCIIGAGCVIDGKIPPRSKVFARPVKGEVVHRASYPNEGGTRK